MLPLRRRNIPKSKAGKNGAKRAGLYSPKKWAAAKRKALNKMGGKWSARAAQLATKYYKKMGGRYVGKK